MRGNFFRYTIPNHARLIAVKMILLALRPVSLGALKDMQYRLRRYRENLLFRSIEVVHDLPDIFHYWTTTHIVPIFREFGMDNHLDFFLNYMIRVCHENEAGRRAFISLGSGNCDFEILLAEMLLKRNVDNFLFECLDINASMLERGSILAKEKGLLQHFTFTMADARAWRGKGTYHIVIANQTLHHFVELESIFDAIRDSLRPNGYFLTNDMIGRNGHMRWPEALEIIQDLWRELPKEYKYNHLTKRREDEFINTDCSIDGFEGIRSQDILPLLVERFSFDLFLAFGNIIDVFVDRAFGHNFSASNRSDTAFIDRVHTIDQDGIESGRITPTHLFAAMVKRPLTEMKVYKHLTPEFCLRKAD